MLCTSTQKSRGNEVLQMRLRVLVTGCAGFIGSHITERLLDMGYEVHGVDDFDPFYAKNIKVNNMRGFIGNPHFHFYEIKMPDESLRLILLNNNIDLVIHLASRAGVGPSMELPVSYIEYDVASTVSLLQVAKEAGVKNIILASSSSVYGNSEGKPSTEDERIDHPISNYAAAKASSELFARVFSTQYQINITVLRIFTVYGPRQRPEMAIHRFVRNIHMGKPVEIYGDGTSKRDYTYISDVVDGIIRSTKNMGGYRIYNLGNGNPVSVIELTEMIAELMGTKIEVELKETRKGDVEHTFADISKAREELGYEPKIGIREGLREFIDWFLSNNTHGRGD